MFKNKRFPLFTLFIFLFISILLLSSCSNSEDTNTETSAETTFQFQIVEPSALQDDALQTWYQTNYKEKGSHLKKVNNNTTYLLISGGEQKTGGYSLELMENKRNADTVVFYTKLTSPQEEKFVTQALTYPHLLIKIIAPEKTVIKAEIDFSEAAKTEVYTAQGTFIGQIDNNSVEITTNHTLLPEGTAPIVFRLSDEAKEFFDLNNINNLNLHSNDKIEFEFIKNENGQYEITRIAKSE